MIITIKKKSLVTEQDRELADWRFFDFNPIKSDHIVGTADISNMLEFNELSSAFNCNVKYLHDDNLKSATVILDV